MPACGELTCGTARSFYLRECARALVTSPDLLIVDEPTASLDAAWAHEVIRLLAETQRSGCALLLASHDGAVAEAAAAVIRVQGYRAAGHKGKAQRAVWMLQRWAIRTPAFVTGG